VIDRGAEQPSARQTTQRCLARLRLVNQFFHDLSSRGILFLLRHRERFLGIASGFLISVSAIRPGNCNGCMMGSRSSVSRPTKRDVLNSR
jgi:hypothetical protein